jgi:hypothetical protein
MKKILFFTVALSMVAGSAMAADMTGRLGLGFVTPSAPVGGRYWISDKVGVDLGVGINVDDQGDESYTNWRVAAGLPINIQNIAERVRFNFLPVVQFKNVDRGDLDADTYITIWGALEFEVHVTPDFTVGASHGVVVDLYSPGDSDAESETDIGFFGANATEFGFHYYLPQ